jgi:Glycoside hydrolase family 44
MRIKTFTGLSFAGFVLILLFSSCGGSGYSGGGGGGGGSAPSAPTGLTATAGNQQVRLSWTASAGATGYHVRRATSTGGPYTQVASPTVTNDTDSTLNFGTKYFYVVTAVNSYGESANSSEASAIPAAPPVSVHLTVNVLDNRHPISQYVYGGSYPKDTATIADSGLSVVRWGGNGTSTYNWKLFTYNADNDYYFEDFTAGPTWDPDSTKFITDVKAAGSNPLMTMAMLPWVAKDAEVASPANNHWSFSVLKYGAQCHVDPFNTDAGSGVVAGANCDTAPTHLVADPKEAYQPLLDDTTQTCPSGQTCVYRNQWAAALATAFGSAPHFYNLDNEIDIWGGTHRDIHPNPTTFQELRDIYLTEARALKGWDPAAIRLGPVTCCWYFYWRSATGASDTTSHGGVDFLPWWLNEVAWSDQVAGNRSLDVFDIHAYPDADTGGSSLTQQQALAAHAYRDWWDPAYSSAAQYIVNGGFSNEPLDGIPFRIPRMRAILNATYPGTQFAITEWSAEFASAADFSTALGDADAYGILGRERVYLASRWTAPDPANPNYLALKLFRNYDGAHHGFEAASVSATHDADPNLFSSFAAVNAAGTSMTVLTINKDPANAVTAAVALNGFAPSRVTSYTLSAATPTSIVASATQAWNSTVTLPKYSVTLFVLSGTTAKNPATTWDPNPDTVMAPAGGTVTLHPAITSANGTVTLGAPTFDTGITVAVTQGSVSAAQNGSVTVTAGNTPGFYHYTLPGTDNAGVTQNQSGWIVVGKPAATFTKTGDGQTGTHGTTLNLSVTLVPGSSGGTATGAGVLFTTDAGSVSSRIVTTNSNGAAAVILTLPTTAGAVHVTAEGPVGLGHPVAVFTETSQ